MTDMQVYRIKKQEDIAHIPTQNPIQLEIYLKGAEISLDKIEGNCLIRATGCSFPNLKEIKGNLSIDAADAYLPLLSIVEGDCNLHEKNIYIVVLQKVRGDLTIYNSVALPELNFIGGKLKNKAKVVIPKLAKKQGNAFVVNVKTDIELLPSDGYFNLIVNLNDCVIPHTEIFGYVQILAKEVSFPYLQSVQRLLIESSTVVFDSTNHPIKFSSLQTIQENCFLKRQWVYFPQLQKIGKKLTIEDSLIDFPKLQAVEDLISNNSNDLSFPSLEIVSNDFEMKKPYQASCNFSSDILTKFLQKTILQRTSSSQFPKLQFIGGNAHFGIELNLLKLEEIGGKLSLFFSRQHLPNLKKINILGSENIENSDLLIRTLPNVTTINQAIYNRHIASVVSKIDKLFFPVINDVFVSKSELFIKNRWNRTSNFPVFPIHTLVAILKMRHSSFQNFQVREYEREWDRPHERTDEILEAIQEHWQEVKAYTYKDIFKIEDRNLRRYCFNYIGVSEMMEALEARKIEVDGIELNYYQYDGLGNKIPFKKHSIFEVYEADLSKIQELRSWRNQDEKVYAVKCWCTTTEHEHWLWIESQYKNDPLAAIASTFRIHENVIPHIKCLKRQGDVLICEMKKSVIPEGTPRPLTKKEYFGLLEVET